MKYIIVLADGMADLPQAELGGLTPMARTKKPMMNALAAVGQVGLCRTVQADEEPGSDVANLAILGYAPKQYLRGRSGLEAAALGVPVAADEMTLRVNLVTLGEGDVWAERRLLDYSAGEIGGAEAAELFNLLAENLDEDNSRIFAGNGFRGIWRGKYAGECSFAAAHDIMGEKIAENLPKGADAEKFARYMERAAEVLAGAAVNKRRCAAGKPQANGIWLWGAGRPVELPDFGAKWGVQGAVVAGASLIKGIARAAGLQLLHLPTATGAVQTDFAGKAQVALEYLLNGGEFAFVHIEAPDEAGHQGDVAAKLGAIERIDAETLRPLVQGLLAAGEDFRLVVMPDHATPVHLRTHTRGAVPLLLFDSRRDELAAAGDYVFEEKSAAGGALQEMEASELLPLLFEK